jgi:glucan endo-1,3-alpha-glucosidase
MERRYRADRRQGSVRLTFSCPARPSVIDAYPSWVPCYFLKITPNSDAIALNIGGDSWQMTQVASAYAAAQALNSPTKLFFSFDFTTSLSCDLADIVSRVKQFSGHGWQFKVGAKPMISSYSGDCLGNVGWQSLKDQTGGYLMPFIWGLEGNFGSYPSMDSWYWCVFFSFYSYAVP